MSEDYLEYRCFHCKTAYRAHDTRCPTCGAFEAVQVRVHARELCSACGVRDKNCKKAKCPYMPKTKAAPKVQLEPADLKRCQAEIRAHRPFALGGTHDVERCPNQPSYIVTEVEPGPDGQYGSMSLCPECLKVLQTKTKIKVKVEPIKAVYTKHLVTV